MSTIPNYPPVATPLTGQEAVPVWQNGKQCSATLDQVLSPGLAQMAEYVGALLKLTWVSLSGVTGSANQLAVVPVDTGTHTDPVVGGTVNNSGFYQWSASPAGWQRISDTQAGLAALAMLRAQNSRPFTTWTALAAATGMQAADRSAVMASDTGTHTDPVVGGTVSNAGFYTYSASPAGWQRTGDLDSQTAAVIAAAAAASAATAASTSLDAANRALTSQRNLFDKDAVTANFAIQATNGAAVAGSGYSASDYIRVVPGGSFTPSAAIFGTGSPYGIAFYDASKVFIAGSGIAGVAAGTAVTVPANAIYTRFCIANSLVAAMHVVNGSVAPTAFRAFMLEDKYGARASFDDRLADLTRDTPNLFLKTTITSGQVINLATGALSANAQWFTSDFIPVIGGRQYVLNRSMPSGSTGFVWFAYDKTTVLGSGANYVAGTAITAPFGAAYMRFSTTLLVNNVEGYQINSPTRCMMVEGTTLPATYRDVGMLDPARVAQRAATAARSFAPPVVDLFDKRRVTASTLLDRSGTISSSTAYFTTDYIPVQQGGVIVSNFDFVPGNGGYGWNWYDRDQNRVGSSVWNGGVANTANGSNQLVVTSLGSAGAPTLGLPISGTGIPTGAYISGGPFGSVGTYTMSTLVNGVATPANATADGTGVTINGGGQLANVPMAVPDGAIFARTSQTSNYVLRRLRITDRSVLSTDVVIGWTDIEAAKPWAGLNFATLGDSIMQSAAEGGASVGGTTGDMQGGLEVYLRTNNTIWAGVSGRKLREVLDGSPSNGLTPFVSADFASINLVYCNAATNDFGIRDVPTQTFPVANCRPIGVLGDTWVPAQASASASVGSMTITVGTFSRGTTFAMGQPIQGTGLQAGTTITSVPSGGGSGNYGISLPTTAALGTIVAGTFYGDLYDIYVRKLLTWNPRMRVAMSTPLQRFDDGNTTGNPVNGLGSKLSDYADAQIAFGGQWSIPVLDLFRRSGINALTMSTYLVDGLHPNSLGYTELVVPFIAKWLETLR